MRRENAEVDLIQALLWKLQTLGIWLRKVLHILRPLPGRSVITALGHSPHHGGFKTALYARLTLAPEMLIVQLMSDQAVIGWVQQARHVRGPLGDPLPLEFFLLHYGCRRLRGFHLCVGGVHEELEALARFYPPR